MHARNLTRPKNPYHTPATSVCTALSLWKLPKSWNRFLTCCRAPPARQNSHRHFIISTGICWIHRHSRDCRSAPNSAGRQKLPAEDNLTANREQTVHGMGFSGTCGHGYASYHALNSKKHDLRSSSHQWCMMAQRIKFAIWCKDACNKQNGIRNLIKLKSKAPVTGNRGTLHHLKYECSLIPTLGLTPQTKWIQCMSCSQGSNATWYQLCKTQTSTMQPTWQMCNAKHTRCKCDANIDQFGNGIGMLRGLMKQPCNTYETSMQWGPRTIKGQTLVHPKTAPKNAQNGGQHLMLTSKLMVPRLRHKKETTYPHQHDLSWHD